MEINELVTLVPNFAGMSHPERIKILAWHVQSNGGQEYFGTSDIRRIYEFLHLEVPNVADSLAKLATRKPPVLLKNRSGYRLEMRARQELDAKYGNRPITISVHKSLAELPPKLSDETKRKYLTECLDCYRAQCYRAAILMVWNLAYDHLLNWLLLDPARIAKFNSQLPARPPFSTGMVISKREDFEWMGETEVVEICGHKNVALITANVKKILKQSIDWRNMAAHPSTVEIKQINAEHTILALVDNVVLRLV